jgi:ankyrin repeat protein
VHPRLGPPPAPLKPEPVAVAPPTLFDAVDENDVKAIQRAKRAALGVTDEDGHSLLFVATRDGRLEIVRALLARGVDPNPRTKRDAAPLYAAAMRNRAREAKLLLAAGAKPELAKDSDGDVALVVAAFREELGVLRVLVGTKPSVAHLSLALLEAAGVGNVKIVKLLLKAGADPDWKSARGNSARSIARQRKQREVLKVFASPSA